MPAKPPGPRNRRDLSRGQSLAEFALVLPILMIILLGIIQFGIVLGAQLGLINATREGTRYGATLASATGTATDSATVYCYTLGMDSSGAACSIGGVTQTGTLARAMPGYVKGNVCQTGAGPCNGEATGVSYCYYPDPNGSTYSLRLNVKVVYRHPLFIPLLSAIVDGIDGQPDNALRVSTSEYFRVEGPAFPNTSGFAAGVAQCSN